MLNNFYSLSILALVLGFRHGFDWDHLAAITDITGTDDNKKHALTLGFLYILGHALVIFSLGLLAVTVGVRLPSWINNVMTPLVGLSLILLGLFLVISLFVQGKNYRMKSRWFLIFDFFNKLTSLIHDHLPHRHDNHKETDHLNLEKKYGYKSTFIIGMIHGIGAETPTQLVLFITAAGTGGHLTGISLLLVFIFGLIVSNTIVTVLSVAGYHKLKKHTSIYLIFGLITAVFSIIVGLSIIFKKVTFLPFILGG